MLRLPTKGPRADALVFGFALLAGVLHVLAVAGDPLVTTPILDLAQYEALARQIASGTLPAEPFFVDPLYLVIRAGLLVVAGEGAGPPIVLNLLALGLAAVGLRRLGLRVLGPPVALGAALALPLCRPLLFFQALPMKETLALALLLWSLLGLLCFLDEGRFGPLLAGGLLFGLTVLARGNALVMAPSIGLALLLAPSARGRRRLVPPALFGAAALVPIAPVTAWNYAVSGELIPITYNLGNNFYQGNNPLHESTDFFNPPFVRDNPTFEEPDWRAEMARRLHARCGPGCPPVDPAAISAAELSRFWLREGFSHVKAKPGRFLLRTGAKALRLLSGAEITNNVPLSYLVARSPLLRFGTYGFAFLLLLGLPGWVLAWPHLRHRRLLLSCALLYVVGVSIFYVLMRLKLLLIPFLLLPAAAGVAALLRRLRGRAKDPAPGRLAAAGGVAVLAALMAFWPWPSREGLGAYNLGVVLSARGDRPGAERAYREAVAANPAFAPARVNLSRLLADRGSLAEALEVARGAVGTNPRHGQARAILGELLLRSGHPDRARVELQRALDLGLRSPQVLLNLGLALARTGREGEALVRFREAWALRPDPASAAWVATALVNLGRRAEARAFLDEVLLRFPMAPKLLRLRRIAGGGSAP